ncbi:MAG: hypothetical protein HQL59_12345 [Magnetococcales bacterium]|nr:hypothetical protein [Magnetococcales bacterium]
MATKTRFLIVCNMKSGSTWLELMLGSLGDVAVDYEFKWRPGYPPGPEHVVIPDRHFRCGEVLLGIGEGKPIVGSKLVLDYYETTDTAYEGLEETIEGDIRVIHVTRDYIDLYLSATFHPGIKLADTVTVDRGSALLRSMLAKNPEVDRMNLVTGQEEQVHVLPESLIPVMNAMLMNDLAAMRLAGRWHYLVVDYAEIRERFGEIVRFIGSSAAPEEITRVLESPPTVKNSRLRPHELISNFGQLERMSQQYDEKRRELVARLAAARKNLRPGMPGSIAPGVVAFGSTTPGAVALGSTAPEALGGQS